ncbi:hypothetical protein PCE1_000297 [Barthelona sp. PCE]
MKEMEVLEPDEPQVEGSAPIGIDVSAPIAPVLQSDPPVHHIQHSSLVLFMGYVWKVMSDCFPKMASNLLSSSILIVFVQLISIVLQEYLHNTLSKIIILLLAPFSIGFMFRVNRKDMLRLTWPQSIVFSLFYTFECMYSLFYAFFFVSYFGSISSKYIFLNILTIDPPSSVNNMLNPLDWPLNFNIDNFLIYVVKFGLSFVHVLWVFALTYIPLYITFSAYRHWKKSEKAIDIPYLRCTWFYLSQLIDGIIAVVLINSFSTTLVPCTVLGWILVGSYLYTMKYGYKYRKTIITMNRKTPPLYGTVCIDNYHASSTFFTVLIFHALFFYVIVYTTWLYFTETEYVFSYDDFLSVLWSTNLILFGLFVFYLLLIFLRKQYKKCMAGFEEYKASVQSEDKKIKKSSV